MTPTVLHLFAGSGGGALGFVRAGFRSLGSVDFDTAACRDLELPTHHLVLEGEDLVLYGPPIDLTSKRATLLVIRAPDGTWHRPLTDRELAVLQGFPADGVLEGPSSSSKKRAGRREHIGNAIPPPTAEAIAREVLATLAASDDGAWRLSAGDVWVSPEEGATA